MVGAYLYLAVCSLKNRVRRRLRRLKEPRYLVGTIVGALYLYFMVFPRSGRRARVPGRPAESLLAAIAGPMQFIGSVILLVVALSAWMLPGVGRSLTFSRSEVQFLFTAPVSRRGLLHYKLLRSQVGIFMSSVITTLLLRPGSLARGWTMVTGLWLMLSVLRLHLMGVALSRRSLAQHGTSGFVHQWLPVSIVAGVVCILGGTVVLDWPTLTSLADGQSVFAELRRLGSTGLAGVVLWPFRALVRLPLAMSTTEFLRGLPPVLVVLAVNYLWVLHSDAAFEEASAEHAEHTAGRSTTPPTMGGKAGAQPFTLAPLGRPETAILWKNLIQLGRYASARTLLRVLPVVIVVGIVAKNAGGAGGIATFLAVLCIPLGILTVFLGPQMLRNDLRQDLGSLAQLKTWPISGPALVRGAVLAPTVVLSVVSWAVILLALVVARNLPFDSGTTAAVVLNRLSYAFAGAVVAPALILSQTVIHNGLAVLFPAWVVDWGGGGGSRSRGIDAMGQRLLMMFAIMMALVVLPALEFSAVVVAQCWVATEVFGRILARTDVSALDAAES